jgi:hypothetical protein
LVKIADSVFLGGGTAEQKLNLSIPLLDVHSTRHGVKTSFREGAAPHIDALPIAAGGALEIAVVQGVDERGSVWTGEALGAIAHQL